MTPSINLRREDHAVSDYGHCQWYAADDSGLRSGLRARVAELEAELSDITIERLREKQTELAENGGCPCCLAGDEEGHILGCELSEAEAELEAAWELVEELDPRHLKRNQMGMRQQRTGEE